METPERFARSLLAPLRTPWERPDHQHELEKELMQAFDGTRLARRRRRFLVTGFTLLSLGAVGAAYPAVSDWWEGWTSTEEVLEDGTKHLIVKDPDGNVDFDDVLAPDESVFMTAEGEYFVLEPLEENGEEPDEGERAAAEIPGEGDE